MKITDFKKEDLEKGIKIRRKEWSEDISISFNKSASIFDAYINCAIRGEKTDLTLEDIISDDWELIEKSTQVWQPQYDEKYYYITTSGNVAQDTFNPSFDKYRLSFKNCFKTRKEAAYMAEKLKIITKLKELSNVDFGNNCLEIKYSICYDIETKNVRPNFNRYSRSLPFEVYFKTEEDCRKAINTIGKENLKKYYFDVED